MRVSFVPLATVLFHLSHSGYTSNPWTLFVLVSLSRDGSSHIQKYKVEGRPGYACRFLHQKREKESGSVCMCVCMYVCQGSREYCTEKGRGIPGIVYGLRRRRWKPPSWQTPCNDGHRRATLHFVFHFTLLFSFTSLIVLCSNFLYRC